MIGNAMLKVLSKCDGMEVWGTVRSPGVLKKFEPALQDHIVIGGDVENTEWLVRTLTELRPQVAINCIGLVKQLQGANDPLLVLPINAMWPHRLARACESIKCRLVQLSTDCVFSGRKGGYKETDEPDPIDLYGRSKLLGEVNYAHTLTLRTSIIGEELEGSHSLVSWFLGQREGVKGFTRAFFSGLPSFEMAEIVRDFVIPHPDLSGLYHVASDRISKYDLLHLLNVEYNRGLHIKPDDTLKIDRSLDPSLFRKMTGYVAPTWTELVPKMRKFHCGK
jgi:dTDP-4-dehydrorhamnose reductase